ncbi:MAG TPA: EAL domain-containing protein [Candidatus Nitrosotalea sp.]|nr:EAL domain-containing protein [Candidatus Nitrosotalea sp.]
MSGGRWRPSGPVRIWLLNLVLLAGGAWLFWTHVDHVQRLSHALLIPWWMLAAAFYLAEVLVVHFQFRRDGHSFSMGEIPLVLGLYFAGGSSLVLAQVVGSALALVVNRRQPLHKAVFNLALLALEASLAVVVFRFLVSGAAHDPQTWAATFAATVLPAALGVGLIQVAISLSDGVFTLDRFGTLLALGLIGTLPNTSLALIGVITAYQDPLGVWLLAVPAATLFLAYRAYASEREKHEGIEFLFESSRMLQGANEIEPAILALLGHVRKMFGADTAEILLFHNPGAAQALLTRVGPKGPLKVMDEVHLSPAESALAEETLGAGGVLVQPSARAASHAAFRLSRGIKEAMIATLRGEDRVLGLMIASDRSGEASSFDHEDLRLFETLAAQASVSLERGRLEQSLAQLRRLEEELKHQAFHDSLTRLANRALFTDRVEHAMARRPDDGSWVAVLFLDLDDFKTVNDTLGHAAGDQLLAAVARRLERCLRSQDTAARLGGDEFAVLLEQVDGEPEATAVASRITSALATPILLQGREVDIHASIGIVVSRPGDHPDELLINADLAMYSAKHEGKGTWRMFDPRMTALVAGRHELKRDMQGGLERGEFSVHYQPVVELRTGRILALEALARWNKPRRGVVAPDQFIPLAEETGLIHDLGSFILREACIAAKRWQDDIAGQGELAISVNVSVRQLQVPGLPEVVAEVLAETGLEPGRLILEVTESAMMEDPELTILRLRELKALGVRLAIDDFGTGYSSLAWLRHFPVDILKLAKPFVDGLGSEPESGAFAEAIAKLGSSLSMTVVAEGIEKAVQLAQLADIELSLGQGFLFTRPMDAAMTEAMLRAPSTFLAEIAPAIS